MGTTSSSFTYEGTDLLSPNFQGLIYIYTIWIDMLTYLIFLLTFSAKWSFVKMEKLKQKKNNNLGKFTSLPTILLVYIWQPSVALSTDPSFLPVEIILMFETCYVHLAWRQGEGRTMGRVNLTLGRKIRERLRRKHWHFFSYMTGDWGKPAGVEQE